MKIKKGKVMWMILFVLTWTVFCMEFALWEEENAKEAIERVERKRV